MSTIVVGLGYGDEGKGSIVDYLARQGGEPLVVRFNGGPQAAHNVVTPDGRHHTFSQYGSATLAGGSTYLSQYMLINPLNLYKERAHLEQLSEAYLGKRLYIDERALVITPWHVIANHLRTFKQEVNGDVHGTCGQGVGETVADYLAISDYAIRVRHLREPSPRLKERLRRFRDFKRIRIKNELGHDILGDEDEEELFLDKLVGNFRDLENVATIVGHDEAGALLRNAGHLIFEGAQGVLLDELYGWHPHTTWSTTTAANARMLVSEHRLETPTVLGVTRAYATRHGQGPFPSEYSAAMPVIGEHNNDDGYQGKFRMGYFDLLAFDYALKACPVDAIAVTCLDQIPDAVQVCDGYKIDIPGRDPWIWQQIPFRHDTTLRKQRLIGRQLKRAKPILVARTREALLNSIDERAPVEIVSYGPTYTNKVASS